MAAMKHILLGIVGIAACSQHNVTTNTTRGGGAVNQHNGHKRSDALARLGE